jgi:hypothetical protein
MATRNWYMRWVLSCFLFFGVCGFACTLTSVFWAHDGRDQRYCFNNNGPVARSRGTDYSMHETEFVCVPLMTWSGWI